MRCLVTVEVKAVGSASTSPGALREIVMSLCTDKFFFRALADSENVRQLVGGRIYNTADDEVESVEETAIPYVMILNNGTQNVTEGKDDEGESDIDSDQISIEVAADTRDALATLCTVIRRTIRRAFKDRDVVSALELGFEVDDYQFSASGVSYDDMKPCYWQQLNYVVETRDIEFESDDDEVEEADEEEVDDDDYDPEAEDCM